MEKRTLDEMISYFNQQVSEMDIKHEDKIKLLGMITAIGYESRKQERKWETCFDCPLSHGCPKISGCTPDQAERYASEIPDDCPIERKTGHWIEDKEASKAHVEKIYRCSACNNFEAWGTTELYNFCSNCGADMRGET